METNQIQMNARSLTCEECTRRISRIYHEQLLPLEALCRRRGLSFRLCGSMIHVCSRHESWYICMHVRTGRMMLLHRSTRRSDARTPHYHEQACRSDSLAALLIYIIGHDELRAEDAAERAGRLLLREQRQHEKQARMMSRRRLARCLSRAEARESMGLMDAAPAA